MLLPFLATASGGHREWPHNAAPRRPLGHPGQIAANAHAKLLEGVADASYPEYVGLFECVYGHHRPYFLGEVAEYGAHGGGGIAREKL